MIEPNPANLVLLGVTAVGGLVGYGRLKEQTSGLRRDVDTKADKAVLEQIDKRLERIEEHVLKLVNNK